MWNILPFLKALSPSEMLLKKKSRKNPISDNSNYSHPWRKQSKSRVLLLKVDYIEWWRTIDYIKTVNIVLHSPVYLSGEATIYNLLPCFKDNKAECHNTIYLYHVKWFVTKMAFDSRFQNEYFPRIFYWKGKLMWNIYIQKYIKS